MEEVQTNHNHVGDTDAATADGNRIVSFIVGDEEGNENSTNQTNHNHMNGDTLSYEDEKEKHDNFPGDDVIKPPGGLDSKSNSYKDMFGLAERRKRLR